MPPTERDIQNETAQQTDDRLSQEWDEANPELKAETDSILRLMSEAVCEVRR
jgi:hypothetical protein